MAERPDYRLAEAVADLVAAGRLAAVHLFRDGRWRATLPPAADWPDLGFLGAGLDSRALAPGQLHVALKGERVDGRDYVGSALRAGATVALTRPWSTDGADPLLSGDPGHDAAVLLCPDPEAALHELARRWRARRDVRLAAVTGTNGKTTTKDLLAALCAHAAPTHATAGNLNNDLGLPLTLLGLRRDHVLAVVEMGASGPGDIDRLAALASPQVGVIINASEAHLAGFGSLEGIVRTKGELLDHLPPDGAAVLNADSPGFDAWRDRAPCPVVSFGVETGEHRWDWRPGPAGGVLTLDGREIEVPLPGRHNGANLAAALLAAEILVGRELEAAAALSHYTGSPHRSRLLDAGGMRLLDDTYNANPESLRTAARAVAELPGEGRVIAVLGAMAELGARSDALHEETGRALRAAGIDLLLAVGAGAMGLVVGFVAAGGQALHCADPVSAAKELVDLARPGDRVLFKGSRSAGMERALEAFLDRIDPDLGRLERR